VLECVEIESGSPATCSVIWLHGLGADGHDFEPIVPVLELHEQPVRFLFPHAPVRPVTINAGMRMRAWYDVRGLALSEKQDEEGIRASAEEVSRLIAHENERGISTRRIVLAGFSQGGAVALHTGLRHPEPLAGILALSTYLPLSESLDAEAHAANRSTPIFQAHGTMDPMVPVELGRTTHELLSERGYAASWHTYPMQHALHPDEITAIGAWLRERF
jgi:phospholipase/carboxylesterase